MEQILVDLPRARDSMPVEEDSIATLPALVYPFSPILAFLEARCPLCKDKLLKIDASLELVAMLKVLVRWE